MSTKYENLLIYVGLFSYNTISQNMTHMKVNIKEHSKTNHYFDIKN